MQDYWKAVLTSPHYAELTYERPAHFGRIWPGMRVLAPLGNSLRAAVLTGRTDAAPEGVAMKPLTWPLDRQPLLDAEYLALAEALAKRQGVALGRVLELVLPARLRTSRLAFSVQEPGFPALVRPRELLDMPAQRLERLAEAWEQGRMVPHAEALQESGEMNASLAQDPPWPVRPNARRQMQVLEHLLTRPRVPLSALKRELGDWAAATVRKLSQRGLVTIAQPPDDPFACDAQPAADTGRAHPLTEEQRSALDGLVTAMDAAFTDAEGTAPGGRLVHGVTGSGKTRLYLEAAAYCLEHGRSALLLAPEVALACQLHRAACERFPELAPVFFHGYQSPARRERTFAEVGRTQGPVLAVGTRSALFLPIRNLGLLVLDEEHDESYRQEERLPYNAKELAYYRMRLAGGLLVLGSATPDLKTFHAAGEGRMPTLRLARRVGDTELPKVRLVAAPGADGKAADPDAPLGAEAAQRLRQVVDAGDQAIILLNRRGYAPLMYCKDCGKTVKCTDCEVGLTYHKARERLLCHYCGKSLAWPLTCPDCGGTDFLPMGGGTERLEEYLKKHFRDVPALRLDRDAVRRQERLEETLAAFREGRAQILVGTQMLSKGHHFPGVTLVVAADGDLGLNLPDYRSAERSFHLLVQVAGRAGRGERPGEVLIQTRNPALPFWKHVLSQDYEAFYAEEIEKRRRFGYPPFTRLGLLRLSHKADWTRGAEAVGMLAGAIRTAAGELGVTALGPAQAPLALLRGRRRFHCLLKAPDWPSVRGVFDAAQRANPDPRRLALSLDLDPVQML